MKVEGWPFRLWLRFRWGRVLGFLDRAFAGPRDLFLEAIEAPAVGWPGRRRYIASQLWRMLVEGLAFVLVVAAFTGATVLVYFALDMPVPR